MSFHPWGDAVNRVAARFRRIWQVIVRWFSELCTIGDPIERKKREDKKAREKVIAAEKARLQGMLDSGRYELVAVWRKVKRLRGRWSWRRSGDAMRAVNPRRRRAKRILAEHGVNYNSGRQRRRFRKTFNRAYRAHIAAAAASKAGPAAIIEQPDAHPVAAAA